MDDALDDLVVARARRGDPSAIESVLVHHAPQVLTICRRMCPDPTTAEDAAQEALLAVARGLPRFDGRSAVSTWVHRIASNAAIDEIRRHKRRPEPVDPEPLRHSTSRWGAAPDPSPPDSVVAVETRRELRAALESLPDDFRQVVVLRDVADLDYAAIAEILDVPVGTVRSRLARARSRLADALADPPEPATGTDGPSAPSKPSPGPPSPATTHPPDDSPPDE